LACSAVGLALASVAGATFMDDWGSAQEVPGSGVLNAGGYARVNSVSCSSDGNCAAGGSYQDGSYAGQAFVVDQTDGIWGSAQEVPGSGVLNADGYAQVISVSCSSDGNCAAGGYYTDGSGHAQAFVVNETAPDIVAVTPADGPVEGGTTVLIRGTHLGEIVGVSFGSVPATSFTPISNTEVRAVAPAGTGIVDITVTSAYGTSPITPADHYTYVAVPTVTRISPSHGSTAGGGVITITGQNLGSPIAVYFGAVKAKLKKLVSADKIEVIAPKHAAGTVYITVTTIGGSSAKVKAGRYTYRKT
jgi:hypothetical protein